MLVGFKNGVYSDTFPNQNNLDFKAGAWCWRICSRSRWGSGSVGVLPWAVKALRTSLAGIPWEGVQLHSLRWPPCPSSRAPGQAVLYFCAQRGLQITAQADSAGSWVLPPHEAVSLRGLLSSCHAPRILNLASRSSEDHPLSVMGCIVSPPK